MDFGARRDTAHADSGSNNFSVFNTGLPMYKWRQGVQRLVILPIKMTDKRNPRVAQNATLKGSNDYDFEVRIHKDLPGGTYVCPKSYGQACPVCEAAAKAKDAGEEYKPLMAKGRAFFNVVDLDNLDKGVQVLDSANGWDTKPQFPQILQQVQTAFDNDAEMQGKTPGAFFADPDNWLMIKVLAVAETFNGKTFFKPSQITLAGIPEKGVAALKPFLDKVYQFEDYIDIPTYKELERVLTGDDEEGSSDDPFAEEEAVPEAPKQETPKPTAKPKTSAKSLWDDDDDTGGETLPF
jgi:hypothetical protein